MEIIRGANPDIPNAEHVFCGMGVQVNLSASASESGGKDIFWGDKGVAFHGKVNAEGGPEGGNGGFVEVSSPESFVYNGFVSLLAPKGEVGMLFLDPTDITISSAATAGLMFVGGVYSSTGGATATLNNGTLSTSLGAGNVTINASIGGGGSPTGNIIFDDPVSWNTRNSSFNSFNSRRKCNIQFRNYHFWRWSLKLICTSRHYDQLGCCIQLFL